MPLVPPATVSDSGRRAPEPGFVTMARQEMARDREGGAFPAKAETTQIPLRLGEMAKGRERRQAARASGPSGP